MYAHAMLDTKGKLVSAKGQRPQNCPHNCGKQIIHGWREVLAFL